MSQRQVAVVGAGEYFREGKHTVGCMAVLNHPLSVTMNNWRLYTVTLASLFALASHRNENIGNLGKDVVLQSRRTRDASVFTIE